MFTSKQETTVKKEQSLCTILWSSRSQTVSTFTDQIYLKLVLLNSKENKIILKYALELKYVSRDISFQKFSEHAKNDVFQC